MPHQGLGKYPADFVETSETVTIDVGDDHPDLVHMGGDHNLRSAARVHNGV